MSISYAPYDMIHLLCRIIYALYQIFYNFRQQSSNWLQKFHDLFRWAFLGRRILKNYISGLFCHIQHCVLDLFTCIWSYSAGRDSSSWIWKALEERSHKIVMKILTYVYTNVYWSDKMHYLTGLFVWKRSSMKYSDTLNLQ